MNERDTKALLQALFERQIDDEHDAVPDERHFIEVLRRGGTFSDDDLAVLMRSPRARRALDIAVERLRAGLRSDWRGRGWSDPVAMPLAASSVQERHSFSTPFYDVKVQQSAPAEWMIALMLHGDVLAAVKAAPAMTVELREDGGRVWLQGRPDRHGLISGLWEWPDESPMQRLAATRLTVVPALRTPLPGGGR